MLSTRQSFSQRSKQSSSLYFETSEETAIRVGERKREEDIFVNKKKCITASRQLKRVTAFRGWLSIHIFMLLFRLIAESSLLTSDFSRECKTAIEIGVPLEEMCDNFLLFIDQKRTIALIPIIFL